MSGAGPGAGEGAGLRPVRIVLTVVIPFGLGYFLSYLFRTVNAVIAPQLVAEAGLTAGDLGLLTSVYFITFAALQLPLGVMLDRYGPRRVEVVLLLVAAIGAVVFALGDDLFTLSLGRGAIGLGVAGCLMAALKANAMWWPPHRVLLMNNIIVAFGSFGAISATAPMEALLQVMGWREVFAMLAAATVAVALLILVIMPERRAGTDRGTSVGAQFGALLRIYGAARFWPPALIFIICYGVFLSYQTLWAGPWLRDVAGLDREAVANYLLLIQLGMFAGVLATGLAADRLRRFGITPLAMVATGTVAFLLIQLMLVAGVTGLAAPLWFGFGFFGSITIICFAVLVERFPADLSGRVMTAANLLIFSVAFAGQWAIGAIIDLFPATASGGYAPGAHRTAMAVMLAFEVAALVYLLWPRRARVAG
jgi:predicted MFS family arabinose efflux permease